MDAFLGAIVGGVVAIAGSVVVARRELTRRHRVRIHLTLLPTLLRSLHGHQFGERAPEPAPAIAAEIEREAVVASRADHRKARAILDCVEAAKDAFDRIRRSAYEDPDLNATQEGQDFEHVLGVTIESAERYRRWLDDRFVSVGVRMLRRLRRW